MDLLANDAPENGGLTVVRFDCEDERQDLRPDHEDKEHGTDHREKQERPMLEPDIRSDASIVPPKSMARLSQDVMPSPPQINLAHQSRTRGSTHASPPTMSAKAVSDSSVWRNFMA